MTKKQLRKLRKRLLDKKLVLIRRIRKIKSDLCDPIGRPVRDSGDQILVFNRRNVLLGQSSLLSLNLRLIEDALERMKEGTYGQCSECGRLIEARRILAVPWALFCVKCQEQKEIRSLAPAGKTPVWLSEKSRSLRMGVSMRVSRWMEAGYSRERTQEESQASS